MTLALLAACTPTHRPPAATSPSPSAVATTPNLFRTASGRGYLRAGSDPSVLPGPVLIADRDNNRVVVVDPHGRVVWQFPRRGQLGNGESFSVPDDAFFTPDGKAVIATHEDAYFVTIVDIATHRIVWRYGAPNRFGSGPNRVWNPDDGLVLPGGDVLLPDIKNCRVLLIAKGSHRPKRIFGTTGQCGHQPPRLLAHPNGAFPMRNGHYIVTEINGAYATEMDLKGKVYRSLQIPGLTYPSDTNEVRNGLFLTVDYNSPGTILEFTPTGRVVWRYKPSGKEALDHPSLALPLPNGDVICNDDRNHRVIVIDPRTNKIVWQYGISGRAGRKAGMLANPDGVDLAPPYSEMIYQASTFGHL